MSISRRSVRARRGSVYLAVLGTSLVATTLLAGAIFVQQAKMRSDRDAADSAAARQTAESGIELARAYIAKTPGWRTGSFINVTGIALGAGTLDVLVTDPVDNDVTNRPYDPVNITCTAHVGRAEQIVTAHLDASPKPIDSLAYAVHTAAKLANPQRLSIGSASASVNGQVDNGGVIEGSVVGGNYKNVGSVFGTASTSSTLRTTPAASVADWYAGIGTQLSGVTTVDKRVLSASLNPFGATNSDGVYYIRSTSNVTIKNSRVLGTLVVICPGFKVTIDNNVLLESANPNFPALIVVGDVEFKYTSDTQLSEASVGVNFNPPGAPYAGVTDGDLADSYPSEIHGLVQVTGQCLVSSNNTIRGLLNTGDKITVNATQTIAYDASLNSWPPIGYAKQIDMPLTAGSLQRKVR